MDSLWKFTLIRPVPAAGLGSPSVYQSRAGGLPRAAAPGGSPHRGLTFVPVGDDDGDPTELRGLKIWSSSWVDALLLRDVDDAAALRCDPDGHTTWQYEGSLTEVVEALLALPAPVLRGHYA